MLKIQEIREIIHLIDESSISEFTYEHEGSQVTIKKDAAPVVTPSIAPVTQQTEVKPQAPVVPEKALQKEENPTDAVEVQQSTTDNVTEIISPMVGTFYRKPTPESDTYVELGDNVKEESIVCIVEAMKLFNEIESEVSGEIVEILVEDGELVEYGQPLFKVKTK